MSTDATPGVPAAGGAVSSAAEAVAAAGGPIGGVGIVGAVPGWTATNTPAAAAQATVTKAAGAAGVRHVCTGIFAMIATGANAQTPVLVNLRDGLTGAGAILWSGVCAAPVNGNDGIAITGVAIVGSPATAMTLEFAAAGVAASQETVTLTGYDIS